MMSPILRLRFARAVVGLAIALTVLSVLPSSLPIVNAMAKGATIQASAPRRVEVGDPIEIAVAIRGAVDVSGYEATARFDRSAVEFGGVVQIGDALKTVGRDPGVLSTETAGGVAFGTYSCALAS